MDWTFGILCFSRQNSNLPAAAVVAVEIDDPNQFAVHRPSVRIRSPSE
jgi:hypothetical protein